VNDLTRAGSFGAWLVQKGLLERNPLQGILKVNARKKSDEQARAFTDPELCRLAPHISRLRKDYADKFAITLISLYSALRVSEAASLHGEDVRDVDGALCLEVSDRGVKDPKTLTSNRIVPVHPALLAWDLLSKNKTGPLFPRQMERKPGGRVSQWFTDLLDRQKMRDAHVTFHSFRDHSPPAWLTSAYQQKS